MNLINKINNFNNVEKEQVIKLLEQYRKWKKGADVDMPNQIELDKAIEYAVEFIKGNIK